MILHLYLWNSVLRVFDQILLRIIGTQRWARRNWERLAEWSSEPSTQQHWKILSPQNTVRISSAPHSSVGNHIRMFAAALIPTLEHGFSVAWFQIETEFYFGNHWMENRDFHVTIVQWKWKYGTYWESSMQIYWIMINNRPAWKPRAHWSHQGDSALRWDRRLLGLCSLASWSNLQSRGSKTCGGGR